ncbi:MAG: hypothetical protein WCX71_05185 [Candidatus Buchananbacteria bacterium]
MENSKNNQHSANNEVLSAVKLLSEKTDKQLDEVLEAVNYFANETRQEFISIRQEMATKQDLAELRMETRQDLAELRMATKQDLAELESRMVTVDKIDEMESRLATKFVTKAYLDDKLADQTLEIFLRLDKRQDKDKNFKEKLVGVISSHDLITAREANDLKELI